MISEIVGFRYAGARKTVKPFIKSRPSKAKIQSYIENRREPFLEKLDDLAISTGTDCERETIQQRIGEMQALRDLMEVRIGPKRLLKRYNRECGELRKNAKNSKSIHNSMWDDAVDRMAAPTERGYTLADSMTREERREVNQIHGALESSDDLVSMLTQREIEEMIRNGWFTSDEESESEMEYASDIDRTSYRDVAANAHDAIESSSASTAGEPSNTDTEDLSSTDTELDTSF